MAESHLENLELFNRQFGLEHLYRDNVIDLWEATRRHLDLGCEPVGGWRIAGRDEPIFQAGFVQWPTTLFAQTMRRGSANHRL